MNNQLYKIKQKLPKSVSHPLILKKIKKSIKLNKTKITEIRKPSVELIKNKKIKNQLN